MWPACLLLLAFSWTELVDPDAASPAHIAALAIAYSALTWAGMIVFGRDTWLRNGEVFSLVFATFGRFAPIAMSSDRLVLRAFGAGLIEEPPVSHFDDGLRPFAARFRALRRSDRHRRMGVGRERRARAPAVMSAHIAVTTAGLVAFWLLFLGAYLGICAVMSLVAGGRPRAGEVARSFALTLVPIAIGYHVAHYLVFLLVQGQYIIPLLSDPLRARMGPVRHSRLPRRYRARRCPLCLVCGARRDRRRPRLRGLSRARASHRGLRAARVALATQVPLTALMVLYTFVGLSITAEPIVERRHCRRADRRRDRIRRDPRGRRAAGCAERRTAVL